ncbi:hypothetical protein [Aurantiacibacter sp. D1-12]|uniref:hypothetical protein n=1 Tax=Aurantiacibacter sp. D1-12 TaxID=2993658 RepID=UPI00237CBD15|nr:hypothetical protein [Aurantiacibacter sp. D1-12]MDE1468451.1 hypothetical protein [Aurantiacibacter sp. D1-12]
MSQTFAFYDERAKAAAAEAEAATLDNVRERSLRAEKTWRGLADQALKVQEDRAKAAKERQARIEREEREQARAELREEAARKWASGEKLG